MENPVILINSRKFQKPGFSLIEILVVIAILSFCLLPLFGLFTSGMRGGAKIADINNAVPLATDLMEIMINRPPEEFQLPRNEQQKKGKFLCELVVIPMDGLSKIAITVSHGRETLSLATIVAW